MTTVSELTQTLQTLFTTTADVLARRTGFVQRQSKLSGALFAQALVFGWLATPQASLENLAQAAAAVGVAISPQGLDQRCTEAAAVFLAALLGAAVQAVVAAEPVAIPLLQRFSAVVLLDCSTIVLPDALGLWWPGCGGSAAAHTRAALKIGVRYDLCRGRLVGPLLCDGRTHESTTPIQNAPLPTGALRLADLGFFDLDILTQIDAQDGYWLARMHRTTAVYDAAGQRWEVLALLAAQGSVEVDLAITLGVQQHLPARLLAVRVPQEVADQRRRRLRAQARDHGRTPSATSLAWPGATGPSSSPTSLRTCSRCARRWSWPAPAGKSSYSSSSGRAMGRSMSPAAASPGVCSRRSVPNSWLWSSNTGCS